MKNLLIFLIAFVFQLNATCIAQHDSRNQKMHIPVEIDSLTQAQFSEHLVFLFSLPSDTIFKIDTSITYKLNFTTSHHFNFEFDFYDSLYFDSSKQICIANPTKIQDSLITLNFLNRDTSFSWHINLSGDSAYLLKVNSFEKLNPHTGKPYNGSASFQLDADFSNIISFNSGQYLIIFERRFVPDIRGSMPPGTDFAYFVEVVR